jgi:peptidoglycan/LPS O-acetylase OafA/YrhL
LGVDIFFVISGVVITTSLFSHSLLDFRSSLLAFYSRRVKRLLPALCVLVVVGAILISLFNPYPGFSLQTGIAALFGFSNLYLFLQSADYFAPSTELNIFTHTWSLGVEEQFYLLFPFLLWLAGPWRNKDGFTNKNKKILAFFILLLSIASLVLFVTYSSSRPAAAYFLMPSRFWEMGVGCLLALWSQRENAVVDPGMSRLNHLISWLSLMAVFVVFKVFSQESNVVATMAIVLLSCLLITAIKPSSQEEKERFLSVYSLLTHPLLITIGYLSYSLYLWHWPVFCLSRWTIGTPVWSFPLLLGLIVLLSLMSYRLVEQPLRKAVWALANGKTIMRGLFATSLSAGFCLRLVGH